MGKNQIENYGAIANSKRGVWMVTPEFADKSSISRSEITEHIKKTRLAGKSKTEVEKILADGDPTNDSDAVPEELEPWRRSLAEVLHSMNPYAFERLAMLLLRECGFSQVRVTKNPEMVELTERENSVSMEFLALMLHSNANGIREVFLRETSVISVVP